jgi:protease IV
LSARRSLIVFIVLFAIMGGAIVLAALAVRSPMTGAPASTVLVWDVPSLLDEAEPPAGSGLFDLLRRDRPTVWMLSHAIRHAAEDDRVRAMVLHVDGIDWGWAKVDEIRSALRAFRASGKPLYASLSGGGEREYLLASAARTIAAPPLAVLELDGLTASAMFFRGTFDKVGITPNFAHVGAYKSGVEPWTRTGLTPESRTALQALVDDHYRLFTDSVAVARRLSSATVERLLDDGPYGARDAKAVGLIDTLLYRVEVDSLATRRTHGTVMTLTRYIERSGRGGGGARIALIPASGTISEGRSRGGGTEGDLLGAETLIRALREARSRESIRAVVLRIDSPGGSAQAADEIWREVKRCREKKPVIVSMSDLAASGGYYIAAPADSIVAEPATLTGSIGVFGGKLNVLGLYHKLGLNVETVSRGKHAGMLSPFRDFTPEEAARFQTQMDEVYSTFLSRVAEGRRLTREQVEGVAAGRVWTGVAASSRGLVDALGGLERAFAMARARAGLDPDEPLSIEVLPHVDRPFFQHALGDLFGDDDDGDTSARVELPAIVRAWIAAASFPSGQTLALMPWSIEIR